MSPPPRRQPARRRALLERETERPRLGAATWSTNCASTPPAPCWTPATATASAKIISRRRSIASSCGSPARCRPAPTCNWSFDDGTIPPKQVNAPCDEAGAAARRLRQADHRRGRHHPAGQQRRQRLDRDRRSATADRRAWATRSRPAKAIPTGRSRSSDEGFCFRRFLGAARGEYFRPSRHGYKGDKACDDNPAGSRRRHRRLGQPRRALDVGGLPPLALRLSAAHRARARGREPAASPSPSCRSPARGATIETRPVRLARRQRMSGRADAAPARAARRSSSCSDVLEQARASRCRAASSTSSCSPSAPTTSSSPASSPTSSSALGVERALFNQGGLIATVPQAQTHPRSRVARRLRQAARRAQAAGRRQPVARRLRVLRPSGDGRATRPAPAGATASTCIRRSPPTARGCGTSPISC